MIGVVSRYFYQGLLSILLWCSFSSCYGCSVITLISSNSHFAVVHRIEAALARSIDPKIKIVHLIANSVQTRAFLEQGQPNACLVVTVGAEALNLGLKSHSSAPLLSLMCRKSMFDQIVREHTQTSTISQPVTAIYFDQPLSRQLTLMKLLLPEHKRLGVVFGSDSATEAEILQALSKTMHFDLISTQINPNENPVAILDELLDDIEVILALPDNHVYNPKTARGMLLAAFRKQVPIIGFSKTYVNNGALAAVHSTTKQIGEESAKHILDILQHPDNALPAPRYPELFTVVVNYQVARSLGMTLDSEQSLSDHIQNAEKHNTNRRTIH